MTTSSREFGMHERIVGELGAQRPIFREFLGWHVGLKARRSLLPVDALDDDYAPLPLKNLRPRFA